MIVTELEAKKRWCPFGRRPGAIRDGDNSIVGFVAQNRGLAMDGALTQCLASECMAWRSRALEVRLPFDESPGHKDDGWQSIGEDWKHRFWLNERAGYCGLAGQPS